MARLRVPRAYGHRRQDQRTSQAGCRRSDGSRRAQRRGAQEERTADAEREAREAQADADRKAAEARNLELSTDPAKLAKSKSRKGLYEEAQRLGIEGRADMSKEELAEEITARR
jgi:hypothetical protein